MLLNSILDPSQTIDPKYLNYTILLKNGEAISGVIQDEAEFSLTLVDSTGKARKLTRNSIELVKRSEKSMMPDGFETKISPAQMSDLLAYVRGL